ncbi:MAG TPA: subclass B3 metallo-beta-lactamase [Terriglobia bacterium]|nr:subclass B3 metallo-beta-lactamase [Terriglobia bacterium]
MAKPTISMSRVLSRSAAIFLLLSTLAAVGFSAEPNQRVSPFRIMGNVYYVGGSNVTSFLIVTRQGSILIDGGYARTAPEIEQNIRKLGFHLYDVKILLNTHAHLDHAGGLAQLKRDTGADFEAMAEDAPTLERGGRGDFYFGNRLTFPAIKPDRILHDGDTVSLGGVTLHAVLTPGHTKGCTTWTWTEHENGRSYHVVDVCSATVLPGYRLVGNTAYPGIARDYRKTFERLKHLPCDVFLASHASFFSMQEKLARFKRDEKSNPFVDPEGYQHFVRYYEAQFQAALKKQERIKH